MELHDKHSNRLFTKNLTNKRKYMSTEKNEKTEDFLALENRIVKRLKTVFDPEIPVNVYDLGLIYKIDISDDQAVTIDMTLTAAGCPMADFILEDVKMKIESIEGVKAVTINLVFDPAWDNSMMSEEAKLELGFL